MASFTAIDNWKSMWPLSTDCLKAASCDLLVEAPWELLVQRYPLPIVRKFKPYKLFQVSFCCRLNFFSFKEETHSIYLRKRGVQWKDTEGWWDSKNRNCYTAWPLGTSTVTYIDLLVAFLPLSALIFCSFLITKAWFTYSEIQKCIITHLSTSWYPFYIIAFII